MAALSAAPPDESVQQEERVASIITFPPSFHLYWIVVECFEHADVEEGGQHKAETADGVQTR